MPETRPPEAYMALAIRLGIEGNVLGPFIVANGEIDEKALERNSKDGRPVDVTTQDRTSIDL